MIINRHRFNGRTILAWLTIAVFLGSLIASGAVLKYRVNNNEEAITKIKVKQNEDHDILIRIETIVEGISKKLDNGK